MAAIIKLLSKFDDSGIRKAKSSFGGLSKTVGALGIGLGLGSLVSYAKTATQGFENAQIASAKLANVMKSMGVGDATKRVDAYAESLQLVTAVDADVIKATQTKLATFANLTTTIDDAGGAFDRATVAALDLAAAGFGSAEGNAVQLGKALNDPIKGISSLAKSGVTFTTQEKAKIKTLVETNKILEAQDIILKAIETQVGGTAEAGASVFDRMKLSMDTVSDSIGEILLPYMKDFTDFLITDVIPNVQSFLKDLSNPDTETGKTFIAIKDAVTDTYNGVKDFFALFGGGDAMKGFGVVASNLIKMLPALLALKGIMMLASAGKAIQSLVTAMTLIQGKAIGGDIIAGGTKGKGKGLSKLIGLPVIGTAAAVLSLSGDTMSDGLTNEQRAAKQLAQREANRPFYGTYLKQTPVATTNNSFVINVQGGDPKVLVDTLSKYSKQNGGLPFSLATAGKKAN
jgi:hypothetical protein